MPYAFDEFGAFLPKAIRDGDDTDPNLWYVCSLLSELAYCHVPAWELENRRRTKLVPAAIYQKIVLRQRATQISAVLGIGGLGEVIELVFVIEQRNTITIGLLAKEVLFVTVRGTADFYDWRINLRATMVPFACGPRPWDLHAVPWPLRRPFAPAGRAHKGFVEEAERIFHHIIEKLRRGEKRRFQAIVVTGHSLGGAVAAILMARTQQTFWFRYLADNEHFKVMSIMFGPPRYSDTVHLLGRYGTPVAICRNGDLVPCLPPRCFGYADHVRLRQTLPEADPYRHNLFASLVANLVPFRGTLFLPHRIEQYRLEIGCSVGAKHASASLLDIDKLSNAA